MTKLDAGLITSLPASDSGSAADWGRKRINPRPQSCLYLAWSEYPSNDDDDDDGNEDDNIKVCFCWSLAPYYYLQFVLVRTTEMIFYKLTLSLSEFQGKQSSLFDDIANWDIPCQITLFSAFFCQPFPTLLKFGMFVGLDEKMSHTKFQVSKSNNF